MSLREQSQSLECCRLGLPAVGAVNLPCDFGRAPWCSRGGQALPLQSRRCSDEESSARVAPGTGTHPAEVRTLRSWGGAC